MTPDVPDSLPVRQPAWLVAGLAGVIAPAAGLVWLATTPPTPPAAAAPLLALGMMGAAMIGAAASGRLRAGALMALATFGALILLAVGFGMRITPADFPATALVAVVAAVSFAVRGALFARSAAPRGWWVALAVVIGEAAMLATAAIRPDTLPPVLLALLPAQWASTAISAGLSSGTLALPQIIALSGTAAATGLVIRLWPRRWTYGVMFSVWIALSALVWHYT